MHDRYNWGQHTNLKIDLTPERKEKEGIFEFDLFGVADVVPDSKIRNKIAMSVLSDDITLLRGETVRPKKIDVLVFENKMLEDGFERKVSDYLSFVDSSSPVVKDLEYKRLLGLLNTKDLARDPEGDMQRWIIKSLFESSGVALKEESGKFIIGSFYRLFNHYSNLSKLETDLAKSLDTARMSVKLKRKITLEAQKLFSKLFGQKFEYFRQYKKLKEEVLARKEEEAQSAREFNDKLAKEAFKFDKEEGFDLALKERMLDLAQRLLKEGTPNDELFEAMHFLIEHDAGVKRVKILRRNFQERQDYFATTGILRTEAMVLQDVISRAAGKGLTEADRLRIEGRVKALAFEVRKITEAKVADETYKKTVFRSTKFGKKYLQKENLKDAGLLPVTEIRLPQKNSEFVCQLSEIFDLGHGRQAVIAYIKNVNEKGKEEYIARSFYRSNSQGLWRYLPGYKLRRDPDTYKYLDPPKVSWFDKGYGEESVTLPFALQNALANVSAGSKPKLIDNPEFFFAGTSKNIFPDEEDGGGKQLLNSFVQVASQARKLKGKLEVDNKHYGDKEKLPPEQIKLAPEHSPNFKCLLGSWRQETSVYGEIDVEIFPSHDGNFRFMFCSDKDGRVWIGGIETDNDLLSMALRDEWVSGGDLCTPGVEYFSQTGGYGHGPAVGKHYQDMFKNYLSKIPVIQEYLEYKKNRKH